MPSELELVSAAPSADKGNSGGRRVLLRGLDLRIGGSDGSCGRRLGGGGRFMDRRLPLSSGSASTVAECLDENRSDHDECEGKERSDESVHISLDPELRLVVPVWNDWLDQRHSFLAVCRTVDRSEFRVIIFIAGPETMERCEIRVSLIGTCMMKLSPAKIFTKAMRGPVESSQRRKIDSSCK